eukprot:304027-Chlamydomonas_euryale.AAC.2
MPALRSRSSRLLSTSAACVPAGSVSQLVSEHGHQPPINFQGQKSGMANGMLTSTQLAALPATLARQDNRQSRQDCGTEPITSQDNWWRVAFPSTFPQGAGNIPAPHSGFPFHAFLPRT